MTNRHSSFDIGVGPIPPVNRSGNPFTDRSSVLHDLLIAVNSLNLGILIADGDGRINLANRMAENILLTHTSLICTRKRSEHLRSGDGHERCLSRAIGNRIQSADNDCLTIEVHGKRPLLVVVLRHADNAPAAISNLSSILFISELTGSQQLDWRRMAGFYGLTRAETRLLDALLNGEKITSYARRACITINTVKGHLSRLFRKTQTSRQSELVLRVLANPLFRLLLSPDG